MKILLFDIETSPNISYTWGKWEQDVIEFKEEWKILCFAAKWLGGKKIFAHRIKGTSDREVVKALWKLFDETDIVVAHNGDSFDVKKTNARFAHYNLPPPSPYKTIDTKKIAKRYFNFNSNSLNDLGKYLGLGEKVETGGFKLWKQCMSGNQEAWRKMIKYNKQDVLLLEKVYLHFRPWMTGHPNVSIDTECPKCGSDNIQFRGIVRTAPGNVYRRFQCNSCGGWGREKNAIITTQTTNA